MNRIQSVGLILGPLLFFLFLFVIEPEGLSAEGRAILASAAWVATWWITGAIPIEVTALLPLILFPLSGGLTLKPTAAAFGHKFIFLFLGGFILALAIEKWNLHKRIALTIIRFIGVNLNGILLGFMLATAFLSMWISNTATSVMMLPIGMAIVAQMKDNPATSENENLIFGKALMLAIAYSASIGGMATLIGTPPNLVLAGVIKETYNIELTFAGWMIIGLPISALLLGICFFYLTRKAFQFQQSTFPGGKTEIENQLRKLGNISFEEKLVLLDFSVTALAWITRSFLLKPIIPAIDDTIIAISAAVVLFILPSGKKTDALLKWEDAKKLPWGILLLFGGGLALAEGFKSSGLASWIGSQLTLLEGISIVLIILLLITAVNFLTEITSNLATTAMLLPILAPMALAIDVHPYALMVSATLAASCAFMLPVATPPNAVVFGSGYLEMQDMIRTGIWLNLISILLLTVIVYFLLPLLWGIEIGAFPTSWK